MNLRDGLHGSADSARAAEAGRRGPALAEVLARPDLERLREHRYRFGQAFVFGVPVVFLEVFGDGLGGATAGLWTGLLQVMLAGWVLYVCAAGMLFEGALLLVRGRMAADLLPAAAATAMYAAGLLGWGRLLLGGGGTAGGWLTASVVTLLGWSGARWWQLSRRRRGGAGK